jgi:hypothetical protein
MSAKRGGPPKGQPWVWLTRDMLAGSAWQGLGINARRLIDFLLIEHMSHGGQRNGYLLAPRDQLVDFGIGYRLISPAIKEARDSGLVDVKPGTGRRPSTFALTWLPVAGHEGERQGFTKVSNKPRSRTRRCPAKPGIKGSLSCTPYKNSYHDSSINTGVYRAERAPQQQPAAPPVPPAPVLTVNGTDHHPAGKPHLLEAAARGAA